MAAWICESEYKIETLMQNLISMIFLYFDDTDVMEDYKDVPGTFADKCKEYVKDSGGFAEFDYMA